MQSKETRIEVDELNHTTFTTYVKVNQGSKQGLANVANIIHSIDGYLLRTLIRRASFNENKVKQALLEIQSELAARMSGAPTHEAEMTDDLQNMLTIYDYSKMLDISIIDHIDYNNVALLPHSLLVKLELTLTKMVELGSSPVLTVHDAFRAHPNHCDTVRYWYKEIMSELAESNILAYIVSQVIGKRVAFVKKSKNLPELIRNSNYGIC